jgi:hypothetical protein
LTIEADNLVAPNSSIKARDHGRVMLRLRARYVSKAAIFEVPASLVPDENRSPA